MRDYASLYALLLEDLGPCADDQPFVTCDMGVDTAARQALASSFHKKLAPGGTSRTADTAALKKFEAINQKIGQFPGFMATDEVESVFYDYWRNNFALCFQTKSGRLFDMEFIRENMMTGPGAAQKADSTYMVSKLFESPMSYMNESLIPIYRAALNETGLWADAERRRFERFGFVRVQGGKLFFAPKNAEISRTCCTEASLEMLIQKACGSFLELTLEEQFGISLATQPDNNRKLACIGSVNGSFGTIDLVSASDSIALELMRREMPNGFLKAMMLNSRSKTAVLPDGRLIELMMISTMGNGFTFPLQTVIFASAVRAVYQMMGLPSHDPRTEFGVFGDDIIVRAEAYEFLCRMLSKLGFEVNVRKSFNTGPFRESCGHDYYSGHLIRGVYIRSLETPQEVCSAINRLNRWQAAHGILLPRVIALLRTWTRDLRVPPSESDDSGIHVPFLLSPGKPVDNAYWFKYRCYRRQVRKVQVPEPDAETVINGFGTGVGFLSGHIRRRDYSFTETRLADDSTWSSRPLTVSVRDGPGARARYRVSGASLPWWDYWPSTKMASSFAAEEVYQSVSLTGGSDGAWGSTVMAHFQR